MNYSDNERLRRLRATFDDNYRVTRLFTTYLESFPELITEHMINTLTEGTDITTEEAIVALLTEIFGLDYNDPKDRRLIREYLTPAVRILDAKRYTENSYYKNVRIEPMRDGAWEFKTESYAPYRAVIANDLIIKDDFTEIPPLGFFTEEFRFPAVLENGNEWMTLTPVDLDSCDAAIDAAHGKVITFGLGLGYYAYMVSQKDDVESITVVERSREVIGLFQKHILPQFPHKEKVRIICADAFDYAEKHMPAEKFDVAFVDIWRDGSDGAVMYKKMKPLEAGCPETDFLYWIEGFIVSRLRAEKFEAMYDRYEGGDRALDYSDFIDEITKTDRLIK